VVSSVQAEDDLVTLDLKNGFFHVKIDPCYRDYLGFQFQNTYYRWTVCPFGLNCSPFYFNKVLSPVTAFLRSQGIRLVLYVDDFLIAAKHNCIIDHRDFVIQTLEELGFLINYDKCVLNPSNRAEFIGYSICSDGPDGSPWFYTLHTKIRKLKNDITRSLAKGYIYARVLAKICGQAIAMSKAIVPGKLKLRALYGLLSKKRSWSDRLFIDPDARDQLIWWLRHVDEWNGAPLLINPPSVQVWTDASSYGWGCVCNGIEACGAWDEFVQVEHINYKELLTILYSLICLKDYLKDKTVRFLCDNVTAVSYVNNLGGPIARLCALAESIWAQALSLNIQIQVLHVPGKNNQEADRLSRLCHQYEWQLHPMLFKLLENLWGPHSIDRFASMNTALLPRYNSRYLDPCSQGVDALSQQDWAINNNYVNPPFRLLNRVVDVLIDQRAYATVIAPYWPKQPWFHRLKSLLVAPPIKINIHRWAIAKSSVLPEPVKNKKWKIYAWRVFGGKGCQA
jgi:hypothetical protein